MHGPSLSVKFHLGVIPAFIALLSGLDSHIPLRVPCASGIPPILTFPHAGGKGRNLHDYTNNYLPLVDGGGPSKARGGGGKSSLGIDENRVSNIEIGIDPNKILS